VSKLKDEAGAKSVFEYWLNLDVSALVKAVIRKLNGNVPK
jgi:hypothetical protein